MLLKTIKIDTELCIALKERYPGLSFNASIRALLGVETKVATNKPTTLPPINTPELPPNNDRLDDLERRVKKLEDEIKRTSNTTQVVTQVVSAELHQELTQLIQPDTTQELPPIDATQIPPVTTPALPPIDTDVSINAKYDKWSKELQETLILTEDMDLIDKNREFYLFRRQDGHVISDEQLLALQRTWKPGKIVPYGHEQESISIYPVDETYQHVGYYLTGNPNSKRDRKVKRLFEFYYAPTGQSRCDLPNYDAEHPEWVVILPGGTDESAYMPYLLEGKARPSVGMKEFTDERWAETKSVYATRF